MRSQEIIIMLRDISRAFELKFTYHSEDIHYSIIFCLKFATPTHYRFIQIRWSCPSPGFYKLNTDGASKGNPGISQEGDLYKMIKANSLKHLLNLMELRQIWGLNVEQF